MASEENITIREAIQGMNSLEDLLNEIERSVGEAVNQAIRQIVLPKQIDLKGVLIQFIETTTLDMKGRAYVVGPVQLHCTYARPERRPE